MFICRFAWLDASCFWIGGKMFKSLVFQDRWLPENLRFLGVQISGTFGIKTFLKISLQPLIFFWICLSMGCAVLESHRSTLRLLNLFVLGGRSGVMISDSHHWKQLHSIQGDADISIFPSDWSLALIRISMLAIGEWVLGYFGVVLIAISHCDG